MSDPIEFYFDFASPYAYLASHRIDAVAARHGREVAWKPMMLGPVFKVAGTRPLTDYPLKGDYSRRDFARTARLLGVPFVLPEDFPFSTLTAARAFYWTEENAPDKAKPLARALFDACFAEGRNTGEAEVVGELAGAVGLDAGAVLAGAREPAIKERLKAVTTDAIENRGVFGAPFFFVDGEPFWGSDRLDQVDRWLATGGW